MISKATTMESVHQSTSAGVAVKYHDDTKQEGGGDKKYNSGEEVTTKTAAAAVAESREKRQHRGAAVTSYTPRDVLSGRGGLALRHPGNRVYRRLVEHNKKLFRNLSERENRALLVQSIVMAVHKHGGRFLKLGSNSGDVTCSENKSWFEVDYREAFVKTSQALREPDRGDKEMRNSSSPLLLLTSSLAEQDTNESWSVSSSAARAGTAVISTMAHDDAPICLGEQDFEQRLLKSLLSLEEENTYENNDNNNNNEDADATSNSAGTDDYCAATSNDASIFVRVEESRRDQTHPDNNNNCNKATMTTANPSCSCHYHYATATPGYGGSISDFAETEPFHYYHEQSSPLLLDSVQDNLHSVSSSSNIRYEKQLILPPLAAASGLSSLAPATTWDTAIATKPPRIQLLPSCPPSPPCPTPVHEEATARSLSSPPPPPVMLRVNGSNMFPRDLDEILSRNDSMADLLSLK